MPDKIQCGVIGAGWWATFAHIPALLAHPCAQLIAIQKRDRGQAERFAADFNVPHACTTVEELLAIEGLSAVVISSTPNLHYAHATAALMANKHVLLEKPMTLTTIEAAHLVQLAQERGLQFLISCPWHFTAHATAAREAIRTGEIGDVRMISILMTNPVSNLLRGASTRPTYGRPYVHPHENTYSDPAIAGAGQIYAQVSHVAAYLTFLTGARATEVFARFHKDDEVLDMYDTINLRMSDDSLVSIASTGVTSDNQRDFEVRIFGTKGIIFLDLWKGSMEVVSLSGERRVLPPLAPDEVYPYQAPARNLIDSILDPRRNQSPATLGLAAMEVIEGACRSAESGANLRVTALMGSCE